MEEQQTSVAPEVVKKQPTKKNQRVGLWTFVGLFVALSVFTTGWLVGSDRLSFRSDGIVPTVVTSPGQAPTEGIDELYRQLVTNFDGDLADEDLLDGMKKGMVKAAGDPFTEYLTASETKDFNDGLNGTFEGIGAELGKEGNFVIIVAPIKGTPADAAGIQPQDIIVAIDGEDATDISITEAVNRIRGPKGEEVVLTIIRNGEQFDVPIVRDTISIDSVTWEMDGSTGVITMSRFGEDTVQLTRQAAEELKASGATGIVLDVRGNPGGLLDASVEVSSIWLLKGSTVLEERRGGETIQTFKTNSQPLLAGMPTVVLINEGSASASEIVAGALRDNNAATIIGAKSFGKGSVQRLIELNSGGSLKVTIARWFTPAGKNIDQEGITPDQEVELTSEDREAERDPQLDAAKSQLQQ